MDFTKRSAYETATYAIIVVYAVLMYRSAPSGPAGRVPKIVLPLLLGLALLQLVCAVSGTANSARQRLWQPFRRLTESDTGEGDVYEYPETDPESGSSWTDDLLMIGWIIAGYISVYLLGVVSGGFVFVLSFMIANGHSIPRSGSVAGVLAGSLWMFSSVLGIRFWSGIVVLPEFMTL